MTGTAEAAVSYRRTERDRTAAIMSARVTFRAKRAIHPAAAYFCKHPPAQLTDGEAFEALEAFIRGD